jgi:flagellar basal body-associated protein FliL
MKKTMLILSAVALVLILAVGGGIWFFISKLTAKEAVPEKSTVETYLNGHWSFYRLRSWDPASGALELDYP